MTLFWVGVGLLALILADVPIAVASAVLRWQRWCSRRASETCRTCP